MRKGVQIGEATQAGLRDASLAVTIDDTAGGATQDVACVSSRTRD